jgi:hypothetical protein
MLTCPVTPRAGDTFELRVGDARRRRQIMRNISLTTYDKNSRHSSDAASLF